MNHRKFLIFLSRWLGIGAVFADDERCHLCGRDAWEIDRQLRRLWPAGCVCLDEGDCRAEREGVRLQPFVQPCLVEAAD